MSVVVTIYSIGAIVFVSVCSFCSHLFWIIFVDSFFVYVYFYFRVVTASAAAAGAIDADAEVLDAFAIVVLFMLLSELSYIYSRLSFGLVWYRRVVHCTQVHYSVRIGVRVTQPSLVEL